MMQGKYTKQLRALVQLNHTHIRHQENEIGKLVREKNTLLSRLDDEDKAITKLVFEKDDFKNNYFKTLAKKTFASDQINFFRNTLESMEAKVMEARHQKNKTQTQIENVQTLILKHRAALKKYSFKNEKYDVLKVGFGA